MLRITTRYLASNFIPPFILGLLSFVSFLITFFMFRVIGLIINKDVGVMTVFSMVGDLGVSFLPLATPLAAFFATVYTLGKLSDDSEIIAMNSFGISKARIYTPFFMLSLMIALSINLLYRGVIPRADTGFNNAIVKLTSAGVLASIKSGQLFTEIPNVTLYAENVSGGGNTFRNVFLHISDKNNSGQKIIFAQSGSLVKIFADEFHVPALRLHLNDGNLVKVDSGTQVEKIIFSEYDFPVLSSENAITILHYDTMKSNAELMRSIELKKNNYEAALASHKTGNELLELKKTFYRTQTELCVRYVSIPQILLFVLLGFLVGVKRGRGNNRNNSSVAIVIIVCYYSLFFYLLSLAHASVLNPVIAIFGPCLLFSGVALLEVKAQ
jgi:lipopolysaccharide export system permease protein